MGICGFFAIAVPGSITGLPYKDPETKLLKESVSYLYLWLIKSWVNQGSDWTLTRIKSLCDWALYYSVQSTYSEPSIESGSPGVTRDGWATFSFLKGYKLSSMRPTRGPYSQEALDETPFLFYEFYSIKGSLPTPSKEKISSSLRKHRETLSSGGETPRYLLDAAGRFMEGYKERFPPDESKAKITINSSSILESSRSKGGRMSWLRSRINSFEDNWILSTLPKTGPIFDALGRYISSGLPDCFEDLFAEVLQITEEDFMNDSSKVNVKRAVYGLLDEAAERGWIPWPTGGWPIYPDAELNARERRRLYSSLYITPPLIDIEGFKPAVYPTRASVVEEQGDKARVITILPGILATLLHIPRTYSYSSLGKDPLVGTISGEGTLFSFMKRANKYFKEHPEYDLTDKILLSLDLTRATDTFHMDYTKALSEGFFKGSPKLIRMLSLLVSSPFSVEYPSEEGIPLLERANRAIPMGNPPSWFILCSFNRSFWAMSKFLESCTSHFHGGASRDRRILKRIFKDGELSEWAQSELKRFPVKVSWDEPLTSLCGDDLIAICTTTRALIFEELVKMAGAIISPGVHFRSESFGIYTKQFCHLDKVKREIHFVDILRVRSLSSPDSRLPGKKEVPLSWTRGTAASRETEWWTGSEEKDSIYRSSCSYLFWKYHEFIKRSRCLGLEIFLPQSFGGLGYPHWKREVRLQGLTKRMLSILLKNDLSLKHLMWSTHLGSVWDVKYHAPLGTWVRNCIDLLLESAQTHSYEFFNVDAPKPEYPKWWELDTYTSKITEMLPEWKPLDVVLKDLEATLYDVGSYRFEGPTVLKVPSLKSVSRSFLAIRKKILDSDHYKFLPLKITDFREVEKRRDWKRKSLMVNTSEIPYLLPSLLYDG